MFVQPKARAGFIVADCAITDEDGLLCEACSKVVFNTGRLPFAIGITGNIHPVIVAKAIGAADFKSKKQIIKGLPDAMQTAMATAAAGGAVTGGEPSLLLRGVVWDFAEKRPHGFMMSSILF